MIGVSVVIRTLNEARHLGDLLRAIGQQKLEGYAVEVVVVDSGSTDGTLEIARQFGCTITHIARDEFSFGRSLNRGCQVATGDILVMISGHCVPATPVWLQSLCEPIAQGKVVYCYGRQIGGAHSRFSECRIFSKYFPDQTAVPQAGFFCNNANSAVARSAWQAHRFDEEVTGLEDMELAQRLHRAAGRIGYVAEACVYHYHNESWATVRRRFEREALALQKIMPQVHVSFLDTVRYILISVLDDWRHAHKSGQWFQKAWEIVLYRYNQYLGSYKGNHDHRKLSHAQKEKYFYPR